MINVAEIQVGDRVGFYRSHMGTIMEKGFGKVTKINGYGHVHVSTEQSNGGTSSVVMGNKVFDKHGDEREKYSKASLCEVAWLEERIASDRAYNEKQRAIRDLLDYIAGRRTGAGNYIVEEEHKAEIKRLTDAI